MKRMTSLHMLAYGTCSILRRDTFIFLCSLNRVVALSAVSSEIRPRLISRLTLKIVVCAHFKMYHQCFGGVMMVV